MALLGSTRRLETRTTGFRATGRGNRHEGTPRQLHQKLRQIIDLDRNGDKEQAERESATVDRLSDRIVALLDEVEREARAAWESGPRRPGSRPPHTRMLSFGKFTWSRMTH